MIDCSFDSQPKGYQFKTPMSTCSHPWASMQVSMHAVYDATGKTALKLIDARYQVIQEK